MSMADEKERKVVAGSDAEVERVTKQQADMDQALVDEHRARMEKEAGASDPRNHLYPYGHLDGDGPEV